MRCFVNQTPTSDHITIPASKDHGTYTGTLNSMSLYLINVHRFIQYRVSALDGNCFEANFSIS
jgi:hypothetical protein